MYEVPVDAYKAKICTVCDKAPIHRYEIYLGEDPWEAMAEREHYEEMGMCYKCMLWDEDDWYDDDWDEEIEDDKKEADYFQMFNCGTFHGWKHMEDDYYGRGARWRG